MFIVNGGEELLEWLQYTIITDIVNFKSVTKKPNYDDPPQGFKCHI